MTVPEFENRPLGPVYTPADRIYRAVSAGASEAYAALGNIMQRDPIDSFEQVAYNQTAVVAQALVPSVSALLPLGEALVENVLMPSRTSMTAMEAASYSGGDVTILAGPCQPPAPVTLCPNYGVPAAEATQYATLDGGSVTPIVAPSPAAHP